MTHTPGPWRLHSDGLSVFGAGPNSQQVADLGVCSPNIKKREQLANARLIATAPELLHALKAATQALKSYAYGNASTDLAREMAAFVDAAIAKAEGATQVIDDDPGPLTADEKNGAAVKPKVVRP